MRHRPTFFFHRSIAELLHLIPSLRPHHNVNKPVHNTTLDVESVDLQLALESGVPDWRMFLSIQHILLTFDLPQGGLPEKQTRC
jgi:hypothetical protein